MRALLTLALLLHGGMLRGGELPASGQIAEWVEALGEAHHSVRRASFELLSDYADRFPRHMLLSLSDHYRAARDPEIRYRLKTLLQPLAGTVLFGLPPGFIGINMDWEVNEAGLSGIRILSVMEGHAGARAGLRTGDLLLAVDDVPIESLGSLQTFSKRIAGSPPGTILRFDLKRAGQDVRIQFPLDPRPSTVERSVLNPNARLQEWLSTLDESRQMKDPSFPVGHFPREK